MTKNRLSNLYFTWMCSLVSNRKRYAKQPSYSQLLRLLHEIDFQYILPMDGNRESDGINLRYRFGYEEGYEDSMIATYLDDRPCSVLEMMVALALRCEESIMDNPDFGDRKGQWFWGMIVSLGLGNQYDENFDEEYVYFVIDRFLNREYERNGKGGLFTVTRPHRDMRSVEIWYQMNWYLEETE